MNRVLEFTPLVLGIILLVCLALVADWVDANPYEPIDCPEGYTDCKGIRVMVTPEPQPSATPVPIPYSPTPEPTPRLTCNHTHQGVEYVHYGYSHIKPEPIPVFDSYSAEWCKH